MRGSKRSVDVDGSKIEARLYEPEGEVAGLCVYFHGGGFAQAEREAQVRASPVAELAAQSKSFWADEAETAAWAEMNRRRRH